MLFFGRGMNLKRRVLRFLILLLLIAFSYQSYSDNTTQDDKTNPNKQKYQQPRQKYPREMPPKQTRPPKPNRPDKDQLKNKKAEPVSRMVSRGDRHRGTDGICPGSTRIRMAHPDGSHADPHPPLRNPVSTGEISGNGKGDGRFFL